MAKVRKNIFLQGLSGSLAGQIVLRTDKAGRTIVSIKPTYPDDREYSEAQLAQQQRFQQASAYAMDADDPVYDAKAEGTPKSAYNVAMADWFHSPEVDEIDLTAYTGELGETIRAMVRDDVQVQQVSILIATGDDTLVEQGQMTHEQGLWYTYTTTADCPPGPAKVIVTGLDLPGHEGTAEETLTAA